MTRTQPTLKLIALLGIAIVMLGAAAAAPAQTFQTLVQFNGNNGADPDNQFLVQGMDGSLYGTTLFDGAHNNGTVFKMTPAGTLTTLYDFCAFANCTDGGLPDAGLVLGNDGNFYGTASVGGAHNWGTVFKITPNGVLTTLYSFCSKTHCADGETPEAGLVLGTDGYFYGTTVAGGTHNTCHERGFTGCGTIFKISPHGNFVSLHSFNGTDGSRPAGALIQAADGNFYGSATFGGTNNSCSSGTLFGCGTIFKITSSGQVTTLHDFAGTDGSAPTGLLQTADGQFYGTTIGGGTPACSIDGGCGTVFAMTADGTVTTLHSFAVTDGAFPGGLIQATDQNFYGEAEDGGAVGYGTIFSITTGGVLTTLHSFNFQGDGAIPEGGLTQHTSGAFYGTNFFGGPFGDGTVFSLSVGLGPFVRVAHNPGRVGQIIPILGQGFTGTTAVFFNGIPASMFVVSSDTSLTATVPAGATTGFVTVTTPAGTLTSNVAFVVQP